MPNIRYLNFFLINIFLQVEDSSPGTQPNNWKSELTSYFKGILDRVNVFQAVDGDSGERQLALENKRDSKK